MDAATGAALGLQLLGPVRAHAGGAALGLGGVKARGVLSLLALHSPHAVPVPELSRWVWGEQPPPSAVATLQAYVSRLRAVLGAGLVVGEPHAYRLALDPQAIDVHRFRDLLRQARRATEHDERAAAELVEAALAQWQGPPLADLQELPGAAADASHLEHERLAALELLLGLRLRLGQHQLALPRLLQLVREHPHDEQLARHLMLALYRGGRQGEALEAYARLRAALVDDLGVEPAPQTRDLHAALLRHDDALLVPAQAGGNLPAATTSFVGRPRELAALPELLLRERVVVLTGPSGVGKTRLALEVAQRLRPADGAWLIDLAAVDDGAAVLRAVTSALGVQEQPGVDPLVTLVTAVGDRDLLLVADGCDRVVDDCLDLVTHLVAECRRLRVLVTGVHPPTSPAACHQVGSLPVPDPGGDGDDDAVALLLARADDDGAQDREALRRLARGAGGLPLHLELVAARLRTSSADQLAAELAQRDGAVLEWSLAARHPDDRRLLARLATFPAAFDADAAAVVAARPLEGALTSLAHASLLFTVRLGDGLRYRLPDAVVASLPTDDDAARRHADVCLELVERAGSRLRSPAAREWMSRLDLEQPSLRDALRWTLRHRPEDALRLVGGLGWYWFRRARISEGRGFVDAALTGEGTDVARSAAHLAGACLSYHAGDLPALERHTREGAAAARAGGGPLARLLLLSAWHAALAVGLEPARAFAQEARLEAEGDPEVLAEALLTLGMIARFSGEPAAAREMLEQSRSVGSDAGNSWAVGSALWIAAKVALEQGQPHEAHRLYSESLRLAVTDDDVASGLVNLHGIARVVAVTGDPQRGAELLGAVAALGERIGYDPVRMDPLDGPRNEQAVREALSDAAMEAAVARGRTASFAEAAALGYAGLRPAG